MALKIPAVRRLPPNLRGRDFYVGDIHGYTELLYTLMQHVNFDSSSDRLISVGDLVDRGPDSVGATALIDEFWFYAVLGNHDLMTLGAFKVAPFTMWEYELRYSDHLKWHQQLTERERELVSYRLASLPLALEVEQPDGRVFGVIHSEVRSELGWKALHDLVTDDLGPFCRKGGNLVDNAVRGREISETLVTALGLVPFSDSWRWFRANSPKIESMALPTPGIDLLISGHTVTPSRHPFAVANRLSIETGAFCDPGRMSLVEPRSNRYWQAGRNPDEPGVIGPHELPKPYTAMDVHLAIQKLVDEQQLLEGGSPQDIE